MIPGLDVGSPQGTITPAQWRQIRAEGRLFAFLRCAEGLGTVDGTFDANVDGARAAGVAIAAYFVLHPWLDPVAQATSWFNACRGLGTGPGELPPVIDIELDHTSALAMTPAEVLASLVACAKAISLLWEREGIVYTFPDFEKRDILNAGDTSPLAGTLLWYAAYCASPPAPPAPWSKITFWQDSGGNKYKTPGGAPCDDDMFLGDETELAALGAPAGPILNPLAGIPVPGLEIPGENE